MKPIRYDDYYWRTELVTLRAVEEGDWELGYYNRFDTPARRLLQHEVELPPTEAEARAFSERFAAFAPEDGRIMFTLLNNDGEVIGGVNLNSIDEKNGTFSIGMQIDRDHRGKGYGTSAMGLLLRYAFFERRLNKYYGHVLEGNIASARMLEKLGCRQEGRRTQMVYTDGRYFDEILYGLTRDEFEANEAAVGGDNG
ncbi:MAG: GNAT family N-acetyltransferase [Armatimonadetes bacterium]|nr:GNAT family N-acetyltransferase [Armatimonadota bacterium]